MPNITDGGAVSDTCTGPTTTGTKGNCRLGGWNFYSGFASNSLKFDPTLGSIYPFVKSTQVYLCPDDGARTGDSYAISSCVAGITRDAAMLKEGKSLAQFDNPAGTLLFGEEASNNNAAGIGANTTNDAYLSYTPAAQDHVSLRHSGGTNFAFVDGHAKYYLLDTANNGETVSAGADTKLYNLQNGLDLNNTQNVAIPTPLCLN